MCSTRGGSSIAVSPPLSLSPSLSLTHSLSLSLPHAVLLLPRIQGVQSQMCSVTLNSTSTTAGSMSSFCSGMMLLPYQSSYLPGVWNVVWMMSLFYLKRCDMAINTHPHACLSTLSISSSPLPRLSASPPPRLHASTPYLLASPSVVLPAHWYSPR